MRVHRLIDDHRHRVTVHLPARASDRMVITFNPIGKGLADTGFGSDIVMSLGFTHVFVAEGGGSQYQHLGTRALRRALDPFLADHRQVFTYGSSLGGHAALFYASALGAQAMALAPRLPVHPCFRPFRHLHPPKMTRGWLRHPDLPLLADPALAPVVLHDPWNAADSTYVDLLVRPAFPLARFLPCRGAGHGIARVLAFQQRLKPLAIRFFQTGDPGPLLFDMKRLPRSQRPPAALPARHAAQATARPLQA